MKVLKIKFSQIIAKITIMVNNVGSKNKCGKVMKNMKPSNNGLSIVTQ